MLMRSEPFREFDRLTEAMLSERRPRQIPVDAYRRGDEFTVLLDLPGVDARFIELTVEKDLLTVRATRGGSGLRATRSRSPNGPTATSPASCSSERAWTVTTSAPHTKMACSRSPSR